MEEYPRSLFGRTVDEVEPAVEAAGASEPIDALTRERGDRLPYRFVRSAPRAAESIGMITAGMIGGVVFAAGPVWLLYRLFAVGEISKWRILLFGVSGFIALGCFRYALRGMSQLLASRTPEPVLELDVAEFHPGERVRMHLVQPGPAKLEELVVTLICTKSARVSTIKEVDVYQTDHEGKSEVTGEKRRVPVRSWDTSTDTFLTVLREENLRVARNERFEKDVQFTVPANGVPTTKAKSLTYNWVIEVEGRPPLWANRVDRFPVIVRPA